MRRSAWSPRQAQQTQERSTIWSSWRRYAKRHELWLHVDGAYGAAAIFSDRHRELVRGIELADSVTIDPHKWLAMPFAAGVVLTSHPEALQQAFATSTPYMPKKSGIRARCSIIFR